jgi:hypothetical protein
MKSVRDAARKSNVIDSTLVEMTGSVAGAPGMSKLMGDTLDYGYCGIVHLWLIPGKDINHLTNINISETTLRKWAKYEQSMYLIVVMR